jgi:hypothetical protein
MVLVLPSLDGRNARGSRCGLDVTGLLRTLLRVGENRKCGLDVTGLLRTLLRVGENRNEEKG